MSSPRALTALVSGAVLVAVTVVGAQLWTSDLGMDERLVAATRVVSEVDPGGAADRAGIALGDVILEDPGLDTQVAERTEREAYAWSYRMGRAMKRGAVPMRIRHGDDERSVTVHPDPGPSMAAALRQLKRLGTELPVAFAFLSVAVLLAFRRSRSERDERARTDVAASFALLGASWVGAWPAPAWPLWLYPVTSFLEVVSSTVGVLLLARFAWSYPSRAAFVEHRAVRLALAAVAVPCALFSMANSLGVIGAPDGLHGNTANLALTSALGLATLVGLAWQRRRAGDIVARRQATWLLAFCGIGIFAPIAILLLPHYGFGIPAPPSLFVFALAFPLLIPVGFAAVVTRYRLFSLDGIGIEVVPYAIAVVTSLVVCFAVTLGLDGLFATYAGAAEANRWIGTFAALIVVEPLRRLVRVFLDRAFSRDRDDFVRRCAELASRLAPLADIAAIEHAVCAVLDTKTAALVHLDAMLGSDGATVLAELGRSSVLRVVELRDSHAVDVLRDGGFELLVLVPSPRTDDARVLALRLPGATAAIGRAERDALALVGRVIGAALAGDVAWRALESEVSRAEQERRQIAMELHDGVGATLTAARSMARRLRAKATDGEQGALDALDETLRDGLGDLRSSLAGLDPAEGEWEALVGHLRRKISDHCAADGIDLSFEHDGDETVRLSPAGRLTVLRVVQEAVNNALKHGSPRCLRVRMALDSNGIEVSVEDDGRGGARAAASGRGLGNMARRVESLDGALRIDSVVPHGTRVAMTLPASAHVFAAPPLSASVRSAIAEEAS